CLLLLGCADGTYDHSRTLDQILVRGPHTIAVAPVVEVAAVERLAQNLNAALVMALQSRVPAGDVQGPDVLMATLLANQSLERFASWRMVYRQTGVLGPRPLTALGKVINARYLLLPIDTYINREKISPKEAQCRGCFVNSNNLWRTKFKVLAELIDIETGTV